MNKQKLKRNLVMILLDQKGVAVKTCVDGVQSSKLILNVCTSRATKERTWLNIGTNLSSIFYNIKIVIIKSQVAKHLRGEFLLKIPVESSSVSATNHHVETEL